MIYAMPGMQTELNAVINKLGVFQGMSSHYSGAGFSGMTFKFRQPEQRALPRPICKSQRPKANRSTRPRS